MIDFIEMYLLSLLKRKKKTGDLEEDYLLLSSLIRAALPARSRR
jgi:hypothetical protein